MPCNGPWREDFKVRIEYETERFEIKFNAAGFRSFALNSFSLAQPYRVLFYHMKLRSYDTWKIHVIVVSCIDDIIQKSSRNKFTDPSLVPGLFGSKEERMPVHGHHHTSSASAQHDHKASQGGGAFGGSFHGKQVGDPGVFLASGTR